MSKKITSLEKCIQELSHKYPIVSYDLYEGIKLAFMSLYSGSVVKTQI